MEPSEAVLDDGDFDGAAGPVSIGTDVGNCIISTYGRSVDSLVDIKDGLEDEVGGAEPIEPFEAELGEGDFDDGTAGALSIGMCVGNSIISTQGRSVESDAGGNDGLDEDGGSESFELSEVELELELGEGDFDDGTAWAVAAIGTDVGN